MAADNISITEDAEMAECEGDKVVTMMDVLQEQQDFEDDANAVLGASDDKNCTYPQGYIKRQALYACLTCCPEAKVDPLKRAGLCLACSLMCHENHELVELYTKRNFRCDCGNPKFSHPCQFTADKTDLNNENIYNQNFSGLYCVCERPYPDPEATFEDDMIQCIVCEDWLHASHLDAVVPGNDQYTEMICKACMEKNKFLNDYTIYAINSESADVDVVNGDKSVNASLCNGDDEKYVNGLDENKDVTSIQTSIVINGTYEDAKEETNNFEMTTDELKNKIENTETASDEIEISTVDNSKIDEKVNDSKISPSEETINNEINSSEINMTTDESSSVKVTDEVNISEVEQSKSDENIDEQVKPDKSSVVESTETNSEIDSTKTDVNIEEININESDKVKSTEQTEKENSEIDSTKMDLDSESQKEDNESKSDLVENGQNSEGNIIEPHTNETSVTEPDQENNTEDVTMDNEPDVKTTKESKVGENEDETKNNEPDIEGTEKSNVTENEDETKDNEPDVEKSESSEIGKNEDVTKDNEPNVKETEESKVGENENATMDNEPDVKETEKSDSAGENTENTGETETFGECKNVDENKKPDDLEQLTEETKMVDTTTDPVVDAIDALLNPDPQEKAVNEKSSPEVPDSTEATITNDMEIDTKQKTPVETKSKIADEEMNGSTKGSQSLTSENNGKVDLDNEPNKTETDNPTKENEALIENGILSENDGTNNDNTTSCNTENSNEHKRKLSTDFTDNKSPKKAKPNEKCVRPTGVKKSHKGATFWHSNFRSKLCTCGECISMYKDLNVLFLTDLEDTVSYYESIGKSNVDNGVSQYEKGMQALSSLDRIQQINALTEYNNMRDKLLDFLKSFKDRKEIVKEEDIKAFFAGMKPRREPDGVYFCR